jgi:hypothetical protein
VVSATVEYGPEVIDSLAGLQVEVQHFGLIEKEWGNHPLLDFILWQEATVGHVMAMTLPQDAIGGHAALAGLLRPVCTADAVVDGLETVAREPDLAGWSADEFRHGLQHVRDDQLPRALTPLTVGLEGLIRVSAAQRKFLTAREVEQRRSGSQLVKRLWDGTGPYEPYMNSWVFGMANVYRHGGNRGAASEQALHVVCGAAIWANHVLDSPAVFNSVEAGLSREVRQQLADGTLRIQPEAEARLRRAAEAAERSDRVQNLLQLRDQLRELREQRQQLRGSDVRTRPPTT